MGGTMHPVQKLKTGRDTLEKKMEFIKLNCSFTLTGKINRETNKNVKLLSVIFGTR